MEVEKLHCLLLFFTLLLMEQLSASKNTKEEIEIELFQNEKLMDYIRNRNFNWEFEITHSKIILEAWREKCHLLGFQCDQS